MYLPDHNSWTALAPVASLRAWTYLLKIFVIKQYFKQYDCAMAPVASLRAWTYLLKIFVIKQYYKQYDCAMMPLASLRA
jgi:hypothetical protein